MESGRGVHVGNRLALFAAILAVALLFAGCTNPSANTYQNATGQPFGQNPDGAIQANGSPQGNQFGSIVQQTTESTGTLEPDLSKPVPQPPVEGKNATLSLGNITIEYYSVAASYETVTLGADFFIRAKNNGSSNETLYAALASAQPAFTWQFFSYQNESVTLEPGKEKTLHYYASNDEPGRAGLLFEFWQKPDRSDKVAANITLYRGTEQDENLAKSAVLYGKVMDKATGNPVPGANVTAYLFSGYSDNGAFAARTDANGDYAVAVPGVDDIASFLGPASAAYGSLDYFITTDAPGYGYGYVGDVSPRRGQKLQKDILLEQFASNASYMQKWETNVSEPYGFFRVAADSGWNYAVAVQAKHPPELGVPSRFYVFDARTGRVVFSQESGNECAGLSLPQGGLTAAVSCNNGQAFALDLSLKNVSLKWSASDPAGNPQRWIELSHDGKLALTGPFVTPEHRYSFVLLDASTGELVAGFEADFAWLRNARFTQDDSKFVVGGSDGVLEMYDTASGKMLWENRIGEFPFVLEVDAVGNTYAGSKGRSVYSFDQTGKQRWTFRVPDHTPYAGAISADGTVFAFSTMQGWVYYVDSATGNINWRKKIASNNAAFNALSMSRDGKTIAVGGAPDNLLAVLDNKGNTLFSHVAAQNNDPILAQKWAGIGYKASENTQRGAMGTAMSADGKKILVAYGDDYVREFEMK